jgi:hypothetical protein
MTNCEPSDHTSRDQVEAPQRGAPLVAAHVPAASGRGGDRNSARSPRLFVGAASVALTAAIAAATARAIEPFAHGIWLTAYLVLVGFVAQLLLGRGQAMVAAAGPADGNPPPIGAQAILWNAGVVAVPLGVLLGARVFVVLGSLALLASLVMFWQQRRPRHAGSDVLEIGYVALIVFMAGSVLVGTALAWDTPWF